MSGLDNALVEHYLTLKSEVVLVKQKLGLFHSNVMLKMKENVNKLYQAKFIRGFFFSRWFANVVSIMKKR